MKFQNSCVIRVPSQRLWDYLTGIPNVAKCLPGVEEVNALEDGKFAGIVVLKVGVVKLRLAGNITIELMDGERYVASMRVQAADQRISGLIQAKLTMNLEKLNPEETKLIVDTDLNLLGKIGEFGQGMIQKKAGQMMADFAGNVASNVGGFPEPVGERVQPGSAGGPSEDPPL